MVLLLCIGCTRINNNNYDVIVNDVIENSNNIYNTNSLGYKYYLPFSINKVYDKERYIFSLDKKEEYKKYYKNIKPNRYFLEIAVPISNSHYALARWFFGKWSIEDYEKIIKIYDERIKSDNMVNK